MLQCSAIHAISLLSAKLAGSFRPYHAAAEEELLSKVPQQHISDDYRGGAVQVVLS